jgi:hypothetical protein
MMVRAARLSSKNANKRKAPMNPEPFLHGVLLLVRSPNANVEPSHPKAMPVILTYERDDEGAVG